MGKSALFNRLVAGNPGDSSSVADGEDGVKGFTAIVHGEAGTTRDRLYGRALWRGRLFEVVDTGGVVLDDEADSPFADEVNLLAGFRNRPRSTAAAKPNPNKHSLAGTAFVCTVCTAERSSDYCSAASSLRSPRRRRKGQNEFQQKESKSVPRSPHCTFLRLLLEGLFRRAFRAATSSWRRCFAFQGFRQ